MKKRLLLLVFALFFSASAAAGPDPQALLAASDAIRNPDFSFGLTNTLVEYRQSKQTESSNLAIYSKADPAGGQFRSLVRYLAPARDAGKLILFNGKDLWFFDPAGKASIRLSPQQRLLGQASNGDVVTVNFAKDYRAVTATEEDTPDGDRQTRHCYRLGLTAATPDTNYQRIDMWATPAPPARSRRVSTPTAANSSRPPITAATKPYSALSGPPKRSSSTAWNRIG